MEQILFSNPNENNEIYIEEKKLPNHPSSLNKDQIKSIYNQMESNVCLIKCDDGGYGTGFFCNFTATLPNEIRIFHVLITNEHILRENSISANKILEFSLDDNKISYKININDSRIIYYNKEYDVTIIEIKKDDKLDKSILF